MPNRAEALEITPRKLPSQARSKATFEAIVEAAAWVLVERGFHGTTTNHIAERAGVNIASLYEYFPGKDAIVALVAERLVGRVLARLAAGLPAVVAGGDDQIVRLWIGLIHRTVVRERELVRVFREQVPYTDVLPASRTLGERLLLFSLEIQRDAGDFVHPDFNPATLQLVVNLVSSTILQLALDPPRGLSQKAVLDELATRVEGWIRRPSRRVGVRG